MVHYVILGVKVEDHERALLDEETIPYDSPSDDKPDHLVAIVDGCNGEFFFVGKVIAKVREEEGESFDVINTHNAFADNYEGVKEDFYRSEAFKPLAGKGVDIYVFSLP